MAILQLTTDFAGQVGVYPRLVRLLSDDNYATVTGSGYLNNAAASGVSILPTDFIFASYAGGFTTFNPSIVGSNITLVPTPAVAGDGPLVSVGVPNVGGVLTTITNASMAQATVLTIPDPGVSATQFILADNAGTQNIATGNLQLLLGTLTLGSSGHASSLTLFPGTAANGTLIISPLNAGGAFNTTLRNSVMGQSSVLSFPDPGVPTSKVLLSDNATGQHVTTGSFSIDSGNLISGLAAGGVIGTLQLFPTTTAKGSLVIAAVANSGNTQTTFQTASLGQATTYTWPDPASAAGAVVVAPAALVSGNLVKASGTLGLVADQGFAMKSVAGAAVGGGAAAQTVTDAFCTTGSMVVATWNTQANAVSILKVVPGNGSFVVTSSGDPGASTLNYIITK